MRNAIPAISAILFTAGLVALLFVPIGSQTAAAATETTKSVEEPLNKTPQNAAEAVTVHRSWKKAALRSGKEIQANLLQLEKQFPKDYQISLERLRDEQNLLGLKESERWNFLAIAAEKALAAKAEKEMLADLEANKYHAKEGFGKLLTSDSKKFNNIFNALKSKKLRTIQGFIKRKP